MKRTYHGSCHCKAVAIEAEIDLVVGSDPDLMDGTRRCNCTFCYKARYWKCFVKPADFRVVKGESDLADYRGPDSNWPLGKIHHRFCKTCGMHPFSKGFLDDFGGWFFCLNLAAIDNATPAELDKVPVKFEDGLHDNFDDAPAVTHYL